MINIRPANSGDVKAIKEIAGLLYIEMPDFVWNTGEFIKKQIKRNEYYVAVSSVASAPGLRSRSCFGGVGKEERIIGIVSLRERDQMLYIETLAVAKEIQSSGIGTKLVEFTKQFARENNFKIMRTTSFYEYDVKDFWVKQGFRMLDEPGEYVGHKFYRLEIKV